jgi:phosphohistidine phosphatase SixA
MNRWQKPAHTRATWFGFARVALYMGMVSALAMVLPAAAQVTVPTGPSASAAITDTDLLRQLRAGGLVAYFRHTTTDFSKDDRQMVDFDDCASQRPLTALGRTQALAIGAEWKRLKLPAGRVLASPYCRTRETAQLMFGRHERSDEVRGGPGEDGSDRYTGLKRLLSTAPVPATANLVISGHGNPYQAVVGAPYLAEGEAAIIRPLGEGRWQVLARLKAGDWARLK